MKFDYLKPEQALKLFNLYLHQMKIKLEDDFSLLTFNNLHNCTPGDFASIYRRSKFMPIKSVSDFYTALVNECNLKEDKSSSVGF